jgi:hypothetical protein
MPILKTPASFVARALPSKIDLSKKRQPMFTLGGPSDEDAVSSFEAYSLRQRSSLTENMRKPPPIKNTTLFKQEVSTRIYYDTTSASDAAINSDSEDDVEESAIEEEDSDEEEWEDKSDEEWEDEGNEEESIPASPKGNSMFERVEFKVNLTSHRSLLTSALHEGDHARQLQNEASRSTSTIRRTRTTTPNSPSTSDSPQEKHLIMRQATRVQPIIQTTSNKHARAMSPRTIRRMMLSKELTSSLRQNLLWERQQKSPTTNAVAKRQHSAISLSALRRAATMSNIPGMNEEAQLVAQDSVTAQPAISSSGTYRNFALDNLPCSRNESFFSREELLSDVYTVLDSRTSTNEARECASVALVGLGGIGKTQIALEYCYRHRADYEVILWFRADNPGPFRDDIVKAAQLLGLLPKESPVPNDFTWPELLEEASRSHAPDENAVTNQDRRSLVAFRIRQHG